VRFLPRVFAICVAFTLGSRPVWGEVVINEFVAAGVAGPAGLKDENGQVQDWIELLNRGPEAVDLRGWSLTDDKAEPQKWTFPARMLRPGEFLVVFASGKDRRAPTGNDRFHTNFKLEGSGEYLALFAPDKSVAPVSEFAPRFPEQRPNVSYGLDGSNRWRYFPASTPGGPNNTTPFSEPAPLPRFGVERGVFEAPFALTLTAPLEGATIRYTTDGSEPTAASGLIYTAPIPIEHTTVVRAATFKEGTLPSRTLVQSYIFLDQLLQQTNRPPGFPVRWGRLPADYEMDLDPLRTNPNDASSPVDAAKLKRFELGLRELPLVSLVMSPADMFGAEGLYPNSEESDVKPSNEKPGSIEMVLPGGKTAFVVDCGIDLHGNASRSPEKNPKHGFKLSFKEEYGPSELKYRLFPDSPVKSFDSLILRADYGVSWRHWSDLPGVRYGALQRTRASRTRDPWFKETFRDMGRVASHNRFCHLFINGLYWGVYDFSEQPTAAFARDYFGGRKTDYDIYDQGKLRAGTADAYTAMLRISNLASPASYDAMQRLLDVPEFIDYMLLHFFVGHQDLQENKNWYAIRRRGSDPEGTFQYVPWDGETLLLDEDVNRVSDPQVPSGLHTKLVQNAEYRLAFADAVFKHMLSPGGALTPPMNIARWKKWQAIVDNPIVAESVRWGDYRRDVHPFQYGSYELYTREKHWVAENERMVNSYFVNRNATVLRQLRAARLYPAVDAPAFNQQGGRLAPGFALTMTAGPGTIYYTTNGADPRVAGAGEVLPGAVIYSGTALPLTRPVTIKARVLQDGVWSALSEAFFTVAP
jgi:hypothetical protein